MTHSYTKLSYHLVWSTKNRHPLIINEVKTPLYNYIKGIIKNESCFTFAINGMADHIHILVDITSRLTVPDFVRTLKTQSSKWMRSSDPSFKDFAWQEGYAAFTVGYSTLDSVSKYIEDQEEHHKTMSFEDEFISFLNKQGIPFDQRFVFG